MVVPLQEKLWNIDLIVDDIKLMPQTYETILGAEKNNGTFQFMLRKKLNRKFKEGAICKTTIPGTRFGKVLFFMPGDKAYTIVFEGGRVGTNVYVFFDFKEDGNFYLYVNEYFELKDDKWIKKFDKKIFKGNVLRIV